MPRAMILAALCALGAACAQTPAPLPHSAMPPGLAHSAAAHAAQGAGLSSDGLIVTPVIGADGGTIGRALFGEGPRGVLVRLDLDAGALPPGWHGLHLHQVGTCADFAAGFQASGAHVGKRDGVLHGLLNPQGPESGDLPNLFAPAAGPFGMEAFSAFVSLAGQGGREAILDEDGTALVIHAGPDDHQSQPIGGAGARIACAALPGAQTLPRPQ